MFKTQGNLERLCKKFDMSYESFREARIKGNKLYSSKMARPKDKWKNYKGWYIKPSL